MIKLKVKEKLKERGRTAADLERGAWIAHGTAYNLARNKGKMISLGVLNKICWFLECKPGDLFEYAPDGGE